MRKKKRITRKEIRTVYEIGYSFVRKVKFDHVSSFAGHAAFIFADVYFSDGDVLHLCIQSSAD